MVDNLRLSLRLTADSRGFAAGVRGAERQVERLSASIDRSGNAARRQATGNQAANAAMRRTARAARQQAAANTGAAAAARNQGAAAAEAAAGTRRHADASGAARVRLLGYAAAATAALYAAGRVAGALVNQADTYTQINNRVRLVTESESQLIAVRRRLFEVSQDTDTLFAANAELYNRLALSAENTTHSQADLLRITEILNKQVAIGGDSFEAAQAGLNQFAQGLASGRLQGDELRSVMEQLLGVSNGLITGFQILRERGQIDIDVTRANIRQMGAEGQLTAQLLLDALLASGEATDEQFQQVEKTVGSALARLGNSFTLFFGRLNEAGGGGTTFTGRLAARINEIADDLADAATRTIEDVREDLEQLARDRDNALQTGLSLIDDPIMAVYQAREAQLREELRLLQQVQAAVGSGSAAAAAATEAPASALAEIDLAANVRRQQEEKERADRRKFLDDIERLDRAHEQRRRDAILQEVDLTQTLRAVREREAEIAFREEIERLDEAHRQRLADNAAAAAEENLSVIERLRNGAASAFQEYGDAATAAADNAREAVNRSLQSMEDALVDFVTTGKLNFRELVDSILADLARLVIRQAITGPLSQALGGALGGLFPGGGIGGGLPGAGGFSNSIAGAPIFHGGGRAGDLSGRRRTGIDPALFQGAPRLHRGGLLGDEVPIIAKRGERVLSRAETADYDGMRQAPEVSINIDNRGAPVDAQVRNQRWDGRRLVVDVLMDDVSRRGPFTQGLQRTFGLREQPV